MTKILLVDDEVALREGLREILEMAGYAVIEAGNGREALAAFAREGADLVITDVVMPDMDGVDLVSALRAERTIPILSMSGGSRVVSARFGLDSSLLAGANACLNKPFSRQQLLDAVAALLGPAG